MRNLLKSLLVVMSLTAVAGAAVSFAWRGALRDAHQSAGTTGVTSLPNETMGSAQLRSLDRTLQNDVTPSFDIVRIEPDGDAVIAGRSVPGAIVELLRDGVLQDKATTDGSGQFVMIPPRFPPGHHELTLTAVQPDGKQVTSNRGVSIAVTRSEAR